MQDDHKIQEPNIEGLEMKMPEGSTIAPTAAESSPSVINGPLLAVLAVLLIAILGGLYYWFSTLTATPAPEPAPAIERPTAEENNEPESTNAEAQADMMLTTSPSDELSAIEADLEATNLETLDAELNAIDAELDTELQ